MKKLLTKFTSIFLAGVFLMSCCIVSVSAEDDPFLTSFGSIPISYKSKYLTDDGYVYKYYFFVRLKDNYRFFCFGKDSDAYIDKLSYLYLTSSSIYFYDENLNSIKLSYNFINFSLSDGSFLASGDGYFSNYLVTGFNYCYGGVNSIENFVDNIIYSDFPLKYGGLTIYDTSKNKNVSIENFVELTNQVAGIGDFIGPVRMEDMYGPYQAPGLYPVEGNANYQGFVNWLIANQKYLELSKYGINCTADNIRSIVGFWSGNYNSISGFFTSLKGMWTSVNAVSQAKNIYNWLQQQWELYKKSLVTWKFEDLPDSVTDVDYDDNGNFITSDIQYLKLILSAIIALPDRIYNTFSDTLSSIDINIYRLSDYITNLPNAIYNNFVDSINMILDAINNIDTSGGGTTENITNNNYYTYNIDVSESEQEAFNGLFAEYNIKYDELIRSKFPFISQVSTIFDEVWEACGYTETSEISLQTIDTKLQNSTHPQQTQQDLINSKMSTIFGNYDANYFNDVDVSNAPVYSVNIAGTECNIIDFRLFAKYRTLIHAFITFVIWIPYLWSLFRSVPGIIANVGDCYNLNILSDLNEYKVEIKDSKFIDIPINHDIKSGIDLVGVGNSYSYYDFDDTYEEYKGG